MVDISRGDLLFCFRCNLGRWCDGRVDGVRAPKALAYRESQKERASPSTQIDAQRKAKAQEVDERRVREVGLLENLRWVLWRAE